jgi:hypothetical protein
MIHLIELVKKGVVFSFYFDGKDFHFGSLVMREKVECVGPNWKKTLKELIAQIEKRLQPAQ